MRHSRVPTSNIISGRDIFELHQTKGLTLEISSVLAAERNMVIDWKEFVEVAVENGWNRGSLIKRIRIACKDAGFNMDKIGERV